MKCPYRDLEMEQGFIQSQRPIIWSTQKKRIAVIPDSSTDVGVTGVGWADVMRILFSAGLVIN